MRLRFLTIYPKAPIRAGREIGWVLAKRGQTVILKYGIEDADQVNAIKEMVGVSKDQTAIRIALCNFYRYYVVGNKTFEPLRNGNSEKGKSEGYDKE